ncbi:pentapeptide repeat-containing protein [Tolypothrix sp. PCC 7910]|uniref:pentapeptide repeat-containing protein n=1 Tax=Tolypothrix sp. PCC 7910 TaxID=2099387 RepID=UPI001FCB2975|nr:pentapeptide repeat-containing protein [Tolypothrix sp. PCC 7910]
MAISNSQQKNSTIPDISNKKVLRIVIENLKQENLEISLAVFDDLAKIAQTEPKLHWQIMKALTNFVRNNASALPQAEIKGSNLLTVRADIQAALTVIASRNSKQDLENEQLDLSHTNISGAKLAEANLAQTNFYQTNLSGADLCRANLQGAILSAANLSGANLSGANLKEAILSAATLSGANLSGANLQRANLYLAKLDGAILNDAITTGANFRDTKFSQIINNQNISN